MSTLKRPYLFEAGAGEPPPDPGAAPPPPEEQAPPQAAMQALAHLAARRGSAIGRWAWRAGLGLVALVLGAAVAEWAERVLATGSVLGWAILALLAVFVALMAAIALREALGIMRLGRIDRLRDRLADARVSGDLAAARAALGGLVALYSGRPDTAWGRARLADRADDLLDADALIDAAEDALLVPLDTAAALEVQSAARRVAAVTALVPLALADIAVALAANLRMIRAIATLYGGRAGTLGTWRLARAVLAHLLATGAVAVGDDLVEPFLGGHLAARVSRRFGEGVINGALTVRVGIAAMEVCRPMPFGPGRRPRLRAILGGALTGLFRRAPAAGAPPS